MVAVGEATVSAIRKNGERASCRVTVLPAPEAISLRCADTYSAQGKRCALGGSTRRNQPDADKIFRLRSGDLQRRRKTASNASFRLGRRNFTGNVETYNIGLG